MSQQHPHNLPDPNEGRLSSLAMEQRRNDVQAEQIKNLKEEIEALKKFRDEIFEKNRLAVDKRLAIHDKWLYLAMGFCTCVAYLIGVYSGFKK